MSNAPAGRPPHAPTPVARLRASRAACLAAFAHFALALGACGAVPHSLPPTPPRLAPPSTPVLPTLPATARVLLRLQDPRRLSLRAAGTATLVIEARGSLVHISDGRVGTRFELAPPPEAPGWQIGERTYPGRLDVHVGRTGDLEVVEEVELETYIRGVVASELVLWSATSAELEAQAIVARTYAARVLARHDVLLDSTLDQAYRGIYVPGESRVAQEVARRLARAVEDTAGIVLTREERLLDARYHAACGGGTAALEAVFPEGGPGCPPVACEPCIARAEAELAGTTSEEPELVWRYVATPAALGELAYDNGLGDRLRELRPLARDAAGRWLEVELAGPSGATKALSFLALRQALGFERLPSGRILRMRPVRGLTAEAGLVFEGLGRGHGVGLCQEGAHEYALRGRTSNQILAHYYPGARLTHLKTAAP